MADENKQESFSKKALRTANTANKAVNTAKHTKKAVSKAAAGDYAGAALEALKDENIRAIVLGLIVFITLIPIMMFSLVPNVLFSPSEDAYNSHHDDSNKGYSSFSQLIKGLFGADNGEEVSFYLPFNTVTAHAEETVTDPYKEQVDKGMKDNKSLLVIADQDSDGKVDFDKAPDNADFTMTEMQKVTKDRVEKRHEALLRYIKKDADERINTAGIIYSGYVNPIITYTIKDDFASSAVNTGSASGSSTPSPTATPGSVNPESGKGKIIVLDPGHGKVSTAMSDTDKKTAGFVKKNGHWGEWRHFKNGTWGDACEGSGCAQDEDCWYPIESGDRTSEAEIDLKNAKAAKKYLEEMGYTVRMTRTSNSQNPSFNKRASYAFKNNDTSKEPDAECIVCIHSNASDASVRGSAFISLEGGTYNQQYIMSNYKSQSMQLGKAINDQIVADTSLDNYGEGVINNQSYLMLFHKSPVPVAYLEIGFFDNSSDLNILQSETDKIGKAIAEGIDSIYGSDSSSNNAAGGTNTNKECLKILSLFNVQNDAEYANKDFDSYLLWLGDQTRSGILDFFFGVNDDTENYPGWKRPPKKWKGEMLPQYQYDIYKEVKELKAKNKFKESDYKSIYQADGCGSLNAYFDKYFTSAVSEMIYAVPDISEEVTYTYDTDEEGNTYISSTNIQLTYGLRTRTIDEIIYDVVKFDEAIPRDADGNMITLGSAAHRDEFYREMVGDGEGEGVTLNYFSGIAGGSSSVRGGGGASVVSIALVEAESGYLEKASNNSLDEPRANAGKGNYTKYGAWYPMNGVAWCNIFVSWCADQAGYCTSLPYGDDNIIPKGAGCAATWNWFSNRGLTHRYGDGYTPQAGDLVFRGPGDHIAIVEKVEGDKLWTIEGNTSGNQNDNDGDGVYHKAYTWASNSGHWYGFASPQYPAGVSLGNIGDKITLPANLGMTHSVTYWNTTPWTSGSKQKALVELLGASNKTYGGNVTKNSRNFTCYGQWFAVAMTTTFGDIGQMAFCIQDDGTCYPVMLADAKSQVVFDNGSYSDHNPANKWGHQNGKCVVEFEVDYSMKNMFGFTGSTNSIYKAFEHYITDVVLVNNVFDNQTYLNNVEQAFEDSGLKDAGVRLIKTTD